MTLTAMRPKRNTRAPYRGRCHGQGVHPATRRVDSRMATIETRCLAGVTHLGGVPWYTSPIPSDGHSCWPQSQHRNQDGVLWLERCPCGAARVHYPIASDWFGHNTRATGRALSPSVIRLAADLAHRRATKHERQAVVAGDRQVIQCSYLEATQFAPCGARAYVVSINPASGHDRIAVLVRTHGGRWAQRWEKTLRLHDFRVATLTPSHAHHGDRRLRTFTNDEAARFLAAISMTPQPHANVAAAMAIVHNGGTR